MLIEYAGRLFYKSSNGFVSNFRPTDYYVISKDIFDPIVSEVVHLVNFAVVEVQRIAFVESFPLTGVAFFASLIGYFLVRFLSLWTLCTLGIVLSYSLPPLYLKFQSEIDSELARINSIAEEQLGVVSSKVHQHMDKAVDASKVYAELAMDKVGYKRNIPSVPKETPITDQKAPDAAVNTPIFPIAPTEPFAPRSVPEKVAEPVM